MQPFVTMVLMLRVGLIPGPMYGAELSIRDTTVLVAQDVAARDTFVGHEPPRYSRYLPARLSQGLQKRTSEWGPPPVVQTLQKEDWRDIIAETLNGNQKIANAAMWLASAPLRLRVNQDRVFVSIALRMP